MDAELYKYITLIGDSTLDNRLWVSGVIKNFLLTRLGIKADSKLVRIKKSQRNYFPADLSVIENLMVMLPNSILHDFANDGFTTADCLSGAYRDKVFGKGVFSMYPHEFFSPLIAGAQQIKQANVIVLSIGGNDFREFLVAVYKHPRKKRKEFIKLNFQKVFDSLWQNYLVIVEKILLFNPSARLILMTQYYPSLHQNTCRIYPLLQEISSAIEIFDNSNDPLFIIQKLMYMVYSKIFVSLANLDNNIIVADITSSLNPFDKKNYVRQVEPSGVGSKKIAQILGYLITNPAILLNHAYRFLPEFFTQGVEEGNKFIIASHIDNWHPLAPADIKCRK